MSTWLSLLFDLLTWLMACLMAWGTRWIYDRLFQILFAFVCPAVYSENISSLDFIVLYSQYLTSCGSWLIDIVLGGFCISTMLRSVFLFGRHWAADPVKKCCRYIQQDTQKRRESERAYRISNECPTQ